MIKKQIISALIALSIAFFIVPNMASAWCYSNSNTDHDLNAYTEVCGGMPECDGERYEQICVGEWYVEVSHRGEQFHIAYQIDSWDTFVADEEGFSSNTHSKESVEDGKVYLPRDGEKLEKYILLGFDYDENDQAWAWVGKQGGYLGDYFDKNYYAVECYQNSDCQEDEYCDKYGKQWDEWSCKTKECEAGDTKCSEKEYYNCSDEGEDQYTWVNQGRIIGECNVECLEDKDCSEQEEFVGEKYCYNETAVGRDYKKFECQTPRFDNVVVSENSNHFTCQSEVEQRVVEDCEDICRDSECVIEKGFFEKIWDWITGLVS